MNKTQATKNKNRVMISIRLPKALLAKIAGQAKMQKVNKTKLIERVLTEKLSPKEFGIRVGEGSI